MVRQPWPALPTWSSRSSPTATERFYGNARCRTFATRAVSSFVVPGFTAIAVLSLALAIGGNSLIFGLLDGFVFHPFPYPDPDRLVGDRRDVSEGLLRHDLHRSAVGRQNTRTSSAADALPHVAAFDLGNRNVSGGDVPERVFTAFLLDDLFPVIGCPRHSGAASRRRSSRPGPTCRHHQSSPLAIALRRRPRDPQSRRSVSAGRPRRSSGSCPPDSC